MALSKNEVYISQPWDFVLFDSRASRKESLRFSVLLSRSIPRISCLFSPVWLVEIYFLTYPSVRKCNVVIPSDCTVHPMNHIPSIIYQYMGIYQIPYTEYIVSQCFDGDFLSCYTHQSTGLFFSHCPATSSQASKRAS